MNIGPAGKVTFDPSLPLVVHLDGKMLSNITGSEQVDQLPVLVSGLHDCVAAFRCAEASKWYG